MTNKVFWMNFLIIDISYHWRINQKGFKFDINACSQLALP